MDVTTNGFSGELIQVESLNSALEIVTSQEAPKRKRKRKPTVKHDLTLVIDGGRSRIKFRIFFGGKWWKTSTLPSIVAPLNHVPFGEKGAFEVGEGKKKEIFIVGHAARQYPGHVELSSSQEAKILYFPHLLLGTLSVFPHLPCDKSVNHELRIKLVTLSLAPPEDLLADLKKYKHLAVGKRKYKLSFDSEIESYPEGYGAAIWGQKEITDDEFFTFDIGFGTATLTLYDNQFDEPGRVNCFPNGGGGINSLIQEMFKSFAQRDCASYLTPEELKLILETSTTSEGKICATDLDGNDVSRQLTLAIENWMQDSPLRLSLKHLCGVARNHKIVLCGGGFEISAVRKFFLQSLYDRGICAEKILIPDNPGLVAINQIKEVV